MSSRRFDLDWLRIAAFGLLILYHVGMVYVTWEYHVKSHHASAAIEPLMLLLNPWRLILLFVVSGIAMRFMADALGPRDFFIARVGRLLPPLLLGMFVIVPPQSYYEIAQALSAGRGLPGVSLENFYLRYVTASGGWCSAEGCLDTPTWNHLWFVAYLIIYSALLTLLVPILRRVPARLGRLIDGPGLFLLPWAYLTIARDLLFPQFGETRALIDDWYLHAVYLPAILFGYAIARVDTVFARAARWRWTMLGCALVTWATLPGLRAALGESAPSEALVTAMRAMREAQAWSAILAAIGFFHHHLRNADGPVRRTLTHAVFPFYLIHQTIIVAAAYHLDRLEWPVWIEAPVLIAMTSLGCWLFYEAGRRIGPLRIWIGLPSARHLARKS